MPLDATSEHEPIGERTFLRRWKDLTNANHEIEKTVEAAAAARAVKREIVQALVGYGVSKPVVKHLEQVVEMSDEERDEFVTLTVQLLGYLHIGYTAGTSEQPQSEMFAEQEQAHADSDRRQVSDARIRNDAWNSAKSGAEASDNPYNAGSRDHQTWAQEWSRYRRETEGNGGAPRAKRGRGRKVVVRRRRSGGDHASV